MIWGNETASGVQRIPLADLTDVAAEKLADRDETPALYVGVGNQATGHFDLAFIFNQQSTPDRNLRERGALLVGLRSRGLPIGHPTPVRQPWWDRSNESFPTIPPRQRIATDDGVAVISSTAFDDLPDPIATPGVIAPIAAVSSPDYPDWPTQPSNLPSLIWEPPADGESESDDVIDETPATVLDVVLAEWSAEPESENIDFTYDVQVATNWVAPSTDEPEPSIGETGVDDAVVGIETGRHASGHVRLIVTVAWYNIRRATNRCDFEDAPSCHSRASDRDRLSDHRPTADGVRANGSAR